MLEGINRHPASIIGSALGLSPREARRPPVKTSLALKYVHAVLVGSCQRRRGANAPVCKRTPSKFDGDIAGRLVKIALLVSGSYGTRGTTKWKHAKKRHGKQ